MKDVYVTLKYRCQGEGISDKLLHQLVVSEIQYALRQTRKELTINAESIIFEEPGLFSVKSVLEV